MDNRSENFRHSMTIHTSRCIDKLREGKYGDSITRAAMAEIIGRSCEVGELGYGNVNSAIRYVERIHGVVWRWNKDDAVWRCLNDEERVAETAKQTRAAGRKAKRAIRVAATVNKEKLSDESRKTLDVMSAIAGAVALFTSAPARKALAKRQEVRELRIGDIDKIF